MAVASLFGWLERAGNLYLLLRQSTSWASKQRASLWCKQRRAWQGMLPLSLPLPRLLQDSLYITWVWLRWEMLKTVGAVEMSNLNEQLKWVVEMSGWNERLRKMRRLNWQLKPVSWSRSGWFKGQSGEQLKGIHWTKYKKNKHTKMCVCDCLKSTFLPITNQIIRPKNIVVASKIKTLWYGKRYDRQWA